MTTQQFPEWFKRNRLLNRGYRAWAARYPAQLMQRYGQPGQGLERLGSRYGGWWVPLVQLGPDSVVYSAGIGGDASFDDALIQRVGCRVHGFDPTPHAIEYIATREVPEQVKALFQFHKVGLWDSETVLKFYAPRTRGWIGSFSAENLQGTSEAEAIHAPVERLSHIMKRLGHDHIDFLKMDIEGAEYRVIREVIEQRLDVRWLAVEFDQPVPLAATAQAIEGLAAVGFKLRHVESWNFVFERLPAAGRH